MKKLLAMVVCAAVPAGVNGVPARRNAA